jgi:hypothetical protein
MAISEVLDCGTSSSFELDDGLAIVCHLGVDYDLQVHAVLFHYTLQCL